MARVEISKEIDTEGEELLIDAALEALKEIKATVKEKEFRSVSLEQIVYEIDKKIIWFQKQLSHIVEYGELT